jgi:hypothetical protein
MTRKRLILEALTRSRLVDVARTFEITGLTGRSKDDIVAALARSRAIDIDSLARLSQGDCQVRHETAVFVLV